MALKNTAVKAPVGVTVLGSDARVPDGLDALLIPDGTAAAPGLSHRTDNPGVIRPGTDVWGVATAGVERFRVDASGRFLHGSTAANAFHYIVQPAASSGTPVPVLRIDTASHTGLTATATPDVSMPINSTMQFTTGGAIALQRSINLSGTRTYSATAATQSITEAANLAILAGPAAGANVAITTGYGIFIQTLAVNNGGTVTTAYGLFSNAPSGATTNRAGGFSGDVLITGDVIGGDGAGDNLTLLATSNATPGPIIAEVEPGVEAWRTLATGEFLVGATSLVLSEIALFQATSNTTEQVFVRNLDAGTTARAEIAPLNDAGAGLAVGVTSSGFTPTSELGTAEAYLRAASTPLVIQTILAGDGIRLMTAGTDRASFLSTGEFVVGATSLTQAGDFIEFRRDANASTIFRYRNLTSGTLAESNLSVSAGATDTVLGGVVATSPGFTPTAGKQAGEIIIAASGSGVPAINIETFGAAPIRFTTNQVEEMRLLSGGGLIVNGTAKAASEEFRVVGQARIDSATDPLVIVQLVATSGSPTLASITGAAHTTLTLSTEATDVNFNLARTVQFATGALVTQRAVRVQTPTYAFVGVSTLTTAATVAIGGPPVAGANATITTSIGVNVETVDVTPGAGIVTTAYGLYANAPTGATTNRAAGFNGNVVIDGDHDVTPTTTNEGELGTDSLKFRRVRATTIVADDYEFKGHGQDYTMFEAPEGLRLRNNKTKKMYRIKMEEISAI